MATQLQTRTAWQIDPAHSLVEFSVKHMMFTTVKGRFGAMSGTIWLDDEDPTGASVDVQIDAASIDTREPNRDGHLRSADFLDVESFPTLAFRSTRVERVSDERLRVYGDLTIRGATREVVLDTEISGRGASPWGKQVSGFTAETKISRADFGLSWNVALETGGVLVSDAVKIQLEVEAVKQD